MGLRPGTARGATGLALLAGGCLLALLGAYLAPALADPRHAVPGPYGGIDAVMQAGILEWTSRTWHHPALWVRLPIHWPDPLALASMDSLLGQALLLWPLRPWLGGRVATTYDLALAASLLLGAAACALIWGRGPGSGRGTGRWLAGGTAALTLLGSPYALSQLGHLNQLPPPPLLLSLACLLGALETGGGGERPDGPEGAGVTAESRRRRWAWGWGGALALQAAWGWYGLAEAAVAAAVLIPWGLWRGRSARPGAVGATVRRLLGPALLAAAVAMVLAIPYWQAATRHEGFERSRSEVAAFSADLDHFVRQGAYRGGWFGLAGDRPEADPHRSRQTLNPGWAALALAALGWALRRRLDPRRRREGQALLLAGAAGLVLAFGDSVGLPGTPWRLPLPLGVLQDLLPPLRAFRAAWRFSLLAVVAVAWWAGAGTLLLARGRGRWRPVAVAGALLVVLAESWPSPLPAVRLPAEPELAGPLAAAPPGPVLTLPAPPTEADEDVAEALWLHRALTGGHPVTGGVSGWVPPWTRRLRERLAACEAGAASPAEVLGEVTRAGARAAAVAPAGTERGRWWLRTLTGLGWRERGRGDGIVVLTPPAADPMR